MYNINSSLSDVQSVESNLTGSFDFASTLLPANVSTADYERIQADELSFLTPESPVPGMWAPG
jgi:hypothetical protein